MFYQNNYKEFLNDFFNFLSFKNIDIINRIATIKQRIIIEKTI